LPLDFFTPSRQRYEDVRSFLCVVEYTAVKVRGILFRSTASHGRKYVHDNTGVMMPYAPDGGAARDVYGRIQRIYDHPLFVKSPLLEVEWFKPGGPMLYGKIPRVQVGDSDLNRNHRFWSLGKVWCQNVVFWPERMSARNDPGARDFLAIFRSSHNRVLDR
jgi:hypothetical protein